MRSHLIGLEKTLPMTHQRTLQFLTYAALTIPALPPALFPFFQPYTFGKTVLFEIIVEAMALIWIAARRSQTPAYAGVCDRKKNGKNMCIAFAAVNGLFFLSTIFSANIFAGLWGSSARMDGLFTLLHFLAFFFMLASSLSEFAWRRLMQISVGAGTFAALYGIAQWFGAPFIVLSRGEIFGTLGNPSYLALYLLFTIFLAHHLAQNEHKREIAIILYCAAAIQIIALLLTQVQAAVIALAVGAVVAAYPYVRSRVTLRRSIIALSTLIALFLLFSFSTSFAKLASLSEGSASLSNRIAVWNIALSGIAERPLLGHGANNFEPYYLAQKNKGGLPMPTTGETFDKPHNAYLEIAFSYGIVGLAAYLFLLWAILRRAWRFFALRGMLAGYLVFLFFFFDTFASLLMFFFVMAFLVHNRAEPARPETTPPPTWKPSFQVGAMTALFILLFFAFHYRPLYSAYHARQFLIQADAGTMHEAAKKNALRYRAFNAPFIERAILLTEHAMKK